MPALLIARAARALARRADARFRGIGIRTGQFPVLLALKEHGRLSQSELARLAGVEQPTMAQILGRMERDGLIRREPDQNDRRISHVSLTEASLQKVQPARELLMEGDDEAIAGLSDIEIAYLSTLLNRVISNVS